MPARNINPLEVVVVKSPPKEARHKELVIDEASQADITRNIAEVNERVEGNAVNRIIAVAGVPPMDWGVATTRPIIFSAGPGVDSASLAQVKARFRTKMPGEDAVAAGAQSDKISSSQKRDPAWNDDKVALSQKLKEVIQDAGLPFDKKVKGIRELKAQGADPAVPFDVTKSFGTPSGGRGTLLYSAMMGTPGSSSSSIPGANNLFAALYGEGHDEWPLAVNGEAPVNIIDAVIHFGRDSFIKALPSMMACVNRDAPKVLKELHEVIGRFVDDMADGVPGAFKDTMRLLAIAPLPQEVQEMRERLSRGVYRGEGKGDIPFIDSTLISGNWSIVDEMVKAGLPADTEIDGMKLLQFAALYGNVDLFKALVGAGADIKESAPLSRRGQKILGDACERNGNDFGAFDVGSPVEVMRAVLPESENEKRNEFEGMVAACNAKSRIDSILNMAKLRAAAMARS